MVSARVVVVVVTVSRQCLTLCTYILSSLTCVPLSTHSCRLEGTEDKFRNRESRPEDLQVIAELKEMVTEREALVKKLVVGARKSEKICTS